MKNERDRLRRSAPFSVWIIRALCLVSIGYVGRHWLASTSPSMGGQCFLGGIIGACFISAVATFVRSRVAQAFVIATVILVPFTIFLAVDILVLRGTWWEWLIMFPAQMGIPVALACYLWKAPRVREFFSPTAPPNVRQMDSHTGL